MGLNTAGLLGRCSWCLCWWWWRDHTHTAEQPPVTLGQAGQSSAGRGLTSVEQRVWRLTHMQAADTECSAVYDDIQSDVMMQSDHDHIQSEDIKWSLLRVMQGSYTAIWGAAPLWPDLLSTQCSVWCADHRLIIAAGLRFGGILIINWEKIFT